MNAMQLAFDYWPVTLGAFAALGFLGVNWSWLAPKFHRAKPRSVPAKNIDDLAVAMLPEACKLDPVERDEMMKHVDQIRKITERSMIEHDPPATASKSY